ncbi:M15 family metallopeptidase [Weeksella virosa]|uniref:M15 family metallopeptidase n=1 Tax=Weeksella virosa TaxID=1014 RepID=UPI002554454B|nr:M15 family metallopeptidase [Weeksella virosa]MDK7374841.1 M15 family metallopeptidase [Weeksella virosa]
MKIKPTIYPYFLGFSLLAITPSCAQKTENQSVIGVDNTQTLDTVNIEQQHFSMDELIGKSKLDLVGKDYQLRPEVAKAFEAMSQEARKAGFRIVVVSSYRNYNYQNGIWERKYKANISKKMKPIDNLNKIIEYSTIPGTSRHHWGTDLDIIDISKGYPKDPLNEKHFNEGGQMHEFKKWLDENAENFGFYLVYTNATDRKGFRYEPWHFSYKAISKPMLAAFKKLDIKTILQNNLLMGSENFSDEFIQKYINENIFDINPSLLP